jgi:hypothetical protein
MFVLNYLYSLFMISSVITSVIGIGCLTFIIGIILGVIFTPVKLLVLDHFLPGFNIDGFWTYVFLTVVLNILMIKKTRRISNVRESK